MSQTIMGDISPNRIAVIVGAAEGCLPWTEAHILKMERGSPWLISPFCDPRTLPNIPSGFVVQWALVLASL